MISTINLNQNFNFVQNATLISSASQLFSNNIKDVHVDASSSDDSDKQDIPLNGSTIKLE
jgi:hypothetical protein